MINEQTGKTPMRLPSLAILAIGLSACSAGTPSGPVKLECTAATCQGMNRVVLNAGKSRVATRMNMPSNAEFLDVVLTKDKTVCGRVKGMNALGTEMAPQQFISSVDHVSISPGERFGGIGVAAIGRVIDRSDFNDRWQRLCATG
jgi:hypothetical protein